MGNIECGELLSWGTKEDVRQAVKECIRKAGKGGGHICMSSNSIHGAVNPENYVEMIKAIRDYGKYPISIQFLGVMAYFVNGDATSSFVMTEA